MTRAIRLLPRARLEELTERSCQWDSFSHFLNLNTFALCSSSRKVRLSPVHAGLCVFHSSLLQNKNSKNITVPFQNRADSLG